MSSETAHFTDRLVGTDPTGLPEGFFDRFVFNLHAENGRSPSVIVGLGTYPPADSMDGFVVVSDEQEQRNLRFASELSPTDGRSCGPFAFDVVEPNEVWTLRLGPNEIGVEFDLTWKARARPWFGEIAVTNASSARTSFDHLFQSGRYEGTLTIDGSTTSVDGWFGQRDRSRGVRTMSGGQGLHIWYQAQFAHFSVGFLLVETRSGGRILLEGAVMHENGTVDTIIDVRHALIFDDTRNLVEGDVHVTTTNGSTYRIAADARAGGGFMAGAGYGGHHGKSRDDSIVETDRYALDGSVNPMTLDSSLTDRLCTFDLDGEQGSGIFEFALSRSSSYTYRPSL